MKKAFKCLVFLILLFTTSVIISIIAVAGTPVNDKSRNVPTETTWSSNNYDLVGDDFVYFPKVLPADYLCVQHGGIAYGFVMPTVEFKVEDYHGISDSELKAAKEPDGDNLLFSIDISDKDITEEDDLPTVWVEASQYSGSKYYADLGTEQLNQELEKLSTTGITKYKLESENSFKNDAYAYILGETMNNYGPPRNSYVNAAIWEALENVGEYDGGASLGTLPAPSGGNRTDGILPGQEKMNSLQEEIAEIYERLETYQSELDAVNAEIDELTNETIPNLQNRIQFLIDEIDRLEREISNLEIEIDNLDRKVWDLYDEYYDLIYDRDYIRYRLSSGNLSPQQEEEYQAQLQQIEQRIEEIPDEIQQTQDEIVEKGETLSNKRSELHSDTSELTQRQNDLRASNKKLTRKKQKRETLEKSSSYTEDSQTLKELVEEMEQLLDLIKNADFENDDQNSGAKGLYAEAIYFNRMWNTINSQYGGSYENSIKDATKKENVKVKFDSEKQEYIVGPFSIEYLEVLCGNTSFAGMAGTPELTVNINGQDQLLKWDEDWEFYYNGNARNWSNVYMSGTGSGTKSTYNQYPHNKEEFYLKIKYKKGMNAISKMKFRFRCLEASGSWKKFSGVTTKISWEGRPELADECTTGELCSEGSEHSSSTNHGTSDDPDYCTAGAKCSHGYWHHHYCTLNIYSVLTDDGEEDLQKFARVTASTRNYAGSVYGGTDIKEPSMEFSWEIDLTTSIAGNVWAEVEDVKNRPQDVYLGIMDDDDTRVEKVAVSVYLYQGDEKKQLALAHDENGEEIEWPIFTDSDGYWHVDRLEAPAIEDDEDGRYFYVVEFEYDGQVYDHTVYLGKETGVVTDNGHEAKECTSKEYASDPDTYAKSSMGVEEVDDRFVFDQTFGEITGETAINADNSTKGITSTTDENGILKEEDSGELNYIGKSVQETATSTDGTEDSPTGNTRIQSKLDSPFAEENRVVSDIEGAGTQEKDKRYRMVSSTFYNDTDTHGIGVKKSDYRIQYPLCTMNTISEWTYVLNDTNNGTVNNGAYEGQKYIEEYMLHINLGLLQRRATDISVLKDLNKVTMIVNEQMVCKEFNPYADIKDYSNILFQLEANRMTNQYYELGLYSSDVGYSSYNRYRNAINEVKELKKNTELRVFASYVVRVYNNSETNDVEINELTDYFDSTFTLVDEDIKAPIVDEDMKRQEKVIANKPYYRIISKGENDNTGTDNGLIEWKPTREENLEGFDENSSGDVTWEIQESGTDAYKVSTTKDFDEIKLKNDQYIEIFTTYEIDKEGYENLAESETNGSGVDFREKLLGEKNNVVEVSNYSTYYSDEDKHIFYSGYKAGDEENSGWISGKVDRDSAPNNIDRNDILDRNKHEDDTYMAKTLRINFETYERDMTGFVWEDKKEEELGKYNIKTGNGTLEDSEALIENVEVSMYEVINLDTVTGGMGMYNGIDYYYKVPEEFYNYSSKDDHTGINGTGPMKTSNAKGSDIDGGEAGNYYIYGFLAGDYVLRFDYGAETSGETDDPEYKGEEKSIIKYNGQDYENTSFMAGATEEHLNDKYLDISGKTLINGTDINELAISKARDNESRRMYVDAYSRNIENDRGEILRNRYAEDNDEYIENTRMFAETPVMQVEITDPKIMKPYTSLGGVENINVEKVDPKTFGDDDENDNTSITNYRYTVKNINLGLEERAKTDIRVTQFIEQIILKKQGEPIFVAKFDEETRDVIRDHVDSMNLGKLTTLPQSEDSNNGFYYISIEDEYLNDLSVEIQYNTKLINESEVDFTGKLSGQWLPSHIEELANQYPTSVEYKYVDDEDSIGVENLHDIEETIGKDNDLGISMNYSPNNASSPTDTIRPEVIVYGRYVGRYYYENKLYESDSNYTIEKYSRAEELRSIPVTYVPDVVVKTTVDQMIDYIDVDTSLYEDEVYTNMYWNKVKDDRDSTTIPNELTDLKGLLGKDSYRDTAITDSGDVELTNDVYDEKDRAFVREVNSNLVVSYNEKLEYYPNAEYGTDRQRAKYKDDIDGVNSSYNPRLTKELEPVEYASTNGKDLEENSYSRINLVTRKNVTSGMDADQMSMDNLIEVLVYSNTVGRRDCNSVPGNAMTIATIKGPWCAGYNSADFLRKDANWLEYGDGAERNENNWRMFPENDAFATEFVTLTPPTGISMHNYIKKYIMPIVILLGVIILLITLFGIKQVEIRIKAKNSKI